MSSVLKPKPKPGQSPAEISRKLEFQRRLQTVTNRIHGTANTDEIILELSGDICALFNADRLTIYTVTEDRAALISKVKTGLASFKDLKLPLNELSVAGYVATTRKHVNLRDVYDDDELRGLSASLRFFKEVDKRTGYRTKQMMAAPIVDATAGDLIGVVQLINNKSDESFSALLEEGVVSLAETLAVALRQRQRTAAGPRGKYDGLVEAEELELAQRSARRKGLDIEDVLIDEFKVKPRAIGEALALFFGVPYMPARFDRIKQPELLKNLKRDFAESSGWLPIEETAEGLIVLTPDPERLRVSRIVSNVFPKAKLLYRVTTLREFKSTVAQFFGGAGGSEGQDLGDVGELLGKLSDDSGEQGSDAEGLADSSLAQDNELVRLVNKIIVDAYHQGASDIHVEPAPGKGKTEIRFRKDGSLVPYISIPASYRNALAARLKIMCDLDISERRRPQDGKINFKRFGPLDIELRVATVPSQGGVEDIVMRILSGGEPIPLEKLGLSARNNKNLRDCIAKPYGLFFVCGPTGSGKTTTLHSILGHLNTPDTKIWTAEDPVEITQKGLRQVQVNPKAGLTFAAAMRAFLRADPDIIMVGEMRDKETTSIGIEASLTGHLVFATLHTNSAPESVIRLLDMGMDPFNFADALLGVLAQRLAKRLCENCKEPNPASPEEIKSMLEEYSMELMHTEAWKKDPKGSYEALYREWVRRFGNGKEQIILNSPVGCATCGGTGYKGRVGLHELLTGTDPVKKLIQERARVPEIVATALAEGMRTLKQDGIEKVLEGITDMKQVRAVCVK